jgi:CRISPR-associated protein Csb2
LRKLDDSGFCSFETTKRSLHVAGMLRHAASRPALLRSIGWSEGDARQIVLGHGEPQGNKHQAVEGARLAFLPLPSIEWRADKKGHVVGSVRRVLVTLRGTSLGDSFQRFIQRFDGQALIDEKAEETTAILRRQGSQEDAIRLYFGKASTWATVTPVILPGYDDPRKLRQRLRDDTETLDTEAKAEVLRKLDQRIDSLLRKALRQAGFSELLTRHAELDWRATGFWPGTDLASRYAAGDQHRRYRRLHVKITWRDSDGSLLDLPGPLCIGSGKFGGMGLFAALPTQPNSVGSIVDNLSSKP